MLHNKSLPLPATQHVFASDRRHEVLRGAFEDLDGQMRNAAVRLLIPGPAFTGRRDDAPALLATEDGTVLDVLGTAFPSLALLTVAISPPHPISAAGFPAPRYDFEEVEMFRSLHRVLRCAIGNADVPLLGRVATASARIHQRRVPKPRFGDLLNVAASFGACGLAIDPGQSGVALIFDPARRGWRWSMRGAARAFRELGMCRTGASDPQDWEPALQQHST